MLFICFSFFKQPSVNELVMYIWNWKDVCENELKLMLISNYAVNTKYSDLPQKESVSTD